MDQDGGSLASRRIKSKENVKSSSLPFTYLGSLSTPTVLALTLFVSEEMLHDMIPLEIYVMLAMSCSRLYMGSWAHSRKYAMWIEAFLEWRIDQMVINSEEPYEPVPNLCVFCEEREGLDFLGGVECWDCFQEH